jgi:hypothetical protein
MNDARKGAFAWGAAMAVLFGVVFVLQYRDTPEWTEAIKPGLVIVTFGFLLKTFADVYSLIFAQRRLNVWSYAAFAIALICLLLLWALGGTARALLFVIGFALILSIIAFVASWLKGVMRR